MTRDFAMVGAGRIEQQEGVSRGSRVNQHKLLMGRLKDPGESLKDRDLFRAGRAQVFFQQSTARRIERGPLGRQQMLTIPLAFHRRIDSTDLQIRHRRFHDHRQVGRRVSCGQKHLMSPLRQLDCNLGRDRRLAHPALPEHHHHAPTTLLDLIDQR